VTAEQMGRIIEELQRTPNLGEELAAWAALTWASSGRPGNVLNLHKMNLTVTEEGLSVLWSDAKTVATRGPFTTHTSMGRYREILTNWMRHPTDCFLFPTIRKNRKTMDMLRNAIRRATNNVKIDVRALRRGTLIAFAQAGATEAQLLHLSGHACTRSLMRYLAWGRYNEEARLALAQVGEQI